EGYEVVLGNGGSTAFWDVAVFGLIEQRSQHLVLGEFSQKFAAESAGAPHLAEPEVLRADPGSAPQPVASAEVDAYAWPHNETSTGVMVPVRRPEGATTDQLVLVDATSVAGAAVVDIAETDAYYFAPPKSLASDGGLWLSVLSPAALERAQRLGRDSSRWIPSFLSLTSAIDNSRKNQTLNTPAVATLVLLAEQIERMLARGGLAWTDERTRTTSGMLQEWAAGREGSTPLVPVPTSSRLGTAGPSARADRGAARPGRAGMDGRAPPDHQRPAAGVGSRSGGDHSVRDRPVRALPGGDHSGRGRVDRRHRHHRSPA